MVGHSDLSAVTGRQRDIRASRPTRRRRACSGSWAAAPAATSARPSPGSLPDEVAAGTPLYLLLDDLAGSTLISGFAFLRWADHVPQIKARLDKRPAAT